VNSQDGDVPKALLFHLVCAQETERKNSFAAGYVVCSSRSTEGLSSLYIRGRSRETYTPPEERARIRRRVRREKLLSLSPCFDNFPRHTEREWQN
jgi:hypothetical protein